MSWSMANLDDVAFFQEGPGVRKWQFRNEGIKLINVKNIVNEQLVTENSDKYLDPLEVEEKYSHFLCDAGDLVMASSGATWGKTAWVSKDDLPLCMNTSMIRFKSLDKKILDIKFLRYYLRTSEFRQSMERLITGSAQPNFGSSHLKQIQIPLPPITDQKRIAAILDKADAIRRKRQQAIQLADEFLRAVFLDMFGDPVTNPKGYEINSIENISSRVTKGESPKWQGFEYETEGVRFITSENVLWGKLDNRMKYISPVFHEKLSRSKVENNDLLVNLVGASVGRACLASIGGMSANINQAVSVVTFDTKKIFPEFALTQILLPSVQRSLLGNVVDAARANISLQNIRELKMMVPSIKIQTEFLKIVRSVEGCGRNLRQFEDVPLFQSLSQKAFSGQL